LYFKAGVVERDWHLAFSTMLTSEARKYYFNKISSHRKGYEEIVTIIRAHFETKQQQERKTTKWEMAKLEHVKEKNPEKTWLECFELMRNKFVED
jgi:hypothetical protein